jgi:GMP synthase (glutamine-hydrolysing)
MVNEAEKKILIVLHQEMSSAGRVGQLLQKTGFTLDIRRPPLGDPLPETLEDHHGVVVFGGPMSANDRDEFIRRETDWLAVPLREEKPFLGICLGAQMLVNHLGGQVESHDQGLVEVGWYPIRPTE